MMLCVCVCFFFLRELSLEHEISSLFVDAFVVAEEGGSGASSYQLN